MARPPRPVRVDACPAVEDMRGLLRDPSGSLIQGYHKHIQSVYDIQFIHSMNVWPRLK